MVGCDLPGTQHLMVTSKPSRFMICTTGNSTFMEIKPVERVHTNPERSLLILGDKQALVLLSRRGWDL